MIHLIGLGLSNAFLGLALKEKNIPFFISEKNHIPDSKTWSFHFTDIPESQHVFIRSLCLQTWDLQQVRFPKYEKFLRCPYGSIRSETFFDFIFQKLSSHIRYEEITDLPKNENFIFDSRCKIFSKGGVQKFFGLDLEFEEPHGLEYPILMDATIPQEDGFTFFYVLPFTPTKMLIEKTYYTLNPVLKKTIKNDIIQYAKQHWPGSFKIVREEKGILAIPTHFDFQQNISSTFNIGLSGGYFHFTTGYSLGFAIRTAEKILYHIENSPKKFSPKYFQQLIQENTKKQSFFMLLNQLMFYAAHDPKRYKVFEHFYKFPIDFIQRFYAADLKAIEKIKIFFGVPPVPISKAVLIFLKFLGNLVARRI